MTWWARQLTTRALALFWVMCAVAAGAMLCGCATALPIVAASSYLVGQTAAAFMPDSINPKDAKR